MYKKILTALLLVCFLCTQVVFAEVPCYSKTVVSDPYAALTNAGKRDVYDLSGLSLTIESNLRTAETEEDVTTLLYRLALSVLGDEALSAYVIADDSLTVFVNEMTQAYTTKDESALAMVQDNYLQNLNFQQLLTAEDIVDLFHMLGMDFAQEDKVSFEFPDGVLQADRYTYTVSTKTEEEQLRYYESLTTYGLYAYMMIGSFLPEIFQGGFSINLLVADPGHVLLEIATGDKTLFSIVTALADDKTGYVQIREISQDNTYDTIYSASKSAEFDGAIEGTVTFYTNDEQNEDGIVVFGPEATETGYKTVVNATFSNNGMITACHVDINENGVDVDYIDDTGFIMAFTSANGRYYAALSIPGEKDEPDSVMYAHVDIATETSDSVSKLTVPDLSEIDMVEIENMTADQQNVLENEANATVFRLFSKLAKIPKIMELIGSGISNSL